MSDHKQIKWFRGDHRFLSNFFRVDFGVAACEERGTNMLGDLLMWIRAERIALSVGGRSTQNSGGLIAPKSTVLE